MVEQTEQTEAKKRGRPVISDLSESTINQAVQDRIIEGISNGETLRAICRERGMPVYSNVYWWMRQERGKEFFARFTKAREAGFDAIADQCMEIADEGDGDRNSDSTVNNEVVSRSKLRVWTRLQLLARWSNRYSERYQHELSGANGGPIETKFEVTFIKTKNSEN
jgi:hypothetical protein